MRDDLRRDSTTTESWIVKRPIADCLRPPNFCRRFVRAKPSEPNLRGTLWILRRNSCGARRARIEFFRGIAIAFSPRFAFLIRISTYGGKHESSRVDRKRYRRLGKLFLPRAWTIGPRQIACGGVLFYHRNVVVVRAARLDHPHMGSHQCGSLSTMAVPKPLQPLRILRT